MHILHLHNVIRQFLLSEAGKNCISKQMKLGFKETPSNSKHEDAQ